MTSLRRVRAEARRIGAIVESDGLGIRVEAPVFHRWAVDELHELVCFDAEDALERMAQGVERCPCVSKCDWCSDNRVLSLVWDGRWQHARKS